MVWHLYILQSEVKETYYIGITNDVERRLHFHNYGHKGHTQRYRPWDLVYTYPFNTRQEALAAECIVKDWKSKRMIRLLIEGKIYIEDYL